jgi:C_GCAxxG_C_C family probable redox protein
VDGAEAAARARALFLDDGHAHGCAETAFVVLKEAYGLPDAGSTSAAMALNGGVAYSGGVCGAITGAAVAIGLLAGERIGDHTVAKRTAREEVRALMDAFRAEFGSLDCRTLIGREIRTAEQHQAFIDSGVWRDVCMAQVEFVVRRLASRADDSGAGGQL